MGYLLVFFILATTIKAEEALWYGLNPSRVYDFVLVDNFENPLPWRFGEKKAVESFSRLVSVDFPQKYRQEEEKYAQSFVVDEEFVKKSAIIFQRNLSDFSQKEANKARELFLSFMHPGKERETYLLKKPITFTGIVKAVVFYLKSHNYQHSLYLLVSAPKIPLQEIYIRDLDFQGWQRFEVKIPAFYLRRNPKKQNLYEFTFHGFSIKSHFRENPGYCHLVLDQILVLVDRSEELLPGFEQKDQWR